MSIFDSQTLHVLPLRFNLVILILELAKYVKIDYIEKKIN